MESWERLRRRLRGEAVDRVPNLDLFMTFAARHLGVPLARYYLDHRILGQANLAVREAFGVDVVQVISDPYREAADLGAEIDFPEDGLPLCRRPLLATPADLGRLRPPAPEAGRRMSDRVAAVAWLHQRLGEEVPVMGWVEGALALAGVLRGVTALLLDLYDRPEWVREILELGTETAIAFARAQAAAGAGIVGLGEAVASQVSPRMYREFALPYEKRIFAAIRERGALGRLHICGDTTHLLPWLAESGADIIDVDWMVDMGAAARAFGERAAVCGNQDPVAVMLQGTPETVAAAVRGCLAAGGPRSLSAAGCEIPPGTPAANLHARAAALLVEG